MARIRLVAITLTVGALVAGVGVSQAAPMRSDRAGADRSLPHVASGHRPGPDALYAPPPRAPQLENRGPWHAQPILVSGAQAYRDGEWLYQDYLFDDHGATGAPDDGNPYGASGHLYSPPGGTFTYPKANAYVNNAADLVELRVKPLRKETAFRVTLNSVTDPRLAAFTLALGSSGSSVAWPHGAGVSSPAELFLTWHGDTVELLDAASGKPVAPSPKATYDAARKQVDVRIPHAAWNPRDARVRTTIGVGLWDTKNNAYLKPQPGEASATTPGGGTPNGVAIVNVGPRFDEPWPTFAGATMADTAAGGMALAPWWRERQQSQQLTLGDVSPFSADVDFGKLDRRVRDDSGVPASGPIDRILASRYVFGQGLDPSKVCFDLASGFDAGAKCVGRFVGQLQPYALYVPKKPAPGKGYGLTLLLHSLSANYNQYAASRNQSELGERGPGSLVLTPAGRGPDGFYAGIAEADTFEAWADVARHYRIDPDWTSVSGYSMGGFGTYRLLARWPDLFARGFSVVGAPGSVDDQLKSLRNTPLLLWNSTEDELVNLKTSEDAVAADTAAGIRFEEDLFLTADHLTLAANDEYTPGASFLGTYRVDRNPAHVSYVVDPREDSTAANAVGDHAYWLSGLAVRDAKAGTGTIDVRSEAFGVGDPKVLGVTPGGGALTGGEIPAMAYVSRTQTWGPTPVAPKRDRLDIDAQNIRVVVIDVRRAGVTCGVQLSVHTDGPLSVVLDGCGRTVRY